MAEPTAEERRKELADAFADGLDIYETRKAERDAKANAEKGGKDDGGTDDKPPAKSFVERLLAW
jgi:hypothetical protein